MAIEVKFTNSLSKQLFEKSEYDLERGILSGAYRKLFNQEIYFRSVEEKQKTNEALFCALKEIPEELLTKEKRALLSRSELEKRLNDYTLESRERISQLEQFQRITVGRELKMAELKEEIEQLKKQKGS